MCDSGKHWATHEGLATLDPLAVRLKDLLDASFLNIAASLQAERMQFPPLLKVADVDALDYFKNFPQLPLLVSATDAQAMNDRREQSGGLDRNQPRLPGPRDPHPAAGGLLSGVQPSPGCAGWPPEDHHHGGQLLSQRKPLPGAAAAEILQHARDRVHRRDGAGDPGAEPARGRVHDLAGALGVETRLENAMDPFFDPNSTRAVTQKMFPTKQEMVYGDDLAISSSNFHRNFFGQRFNISSVDGQTAYTACIGMGLERWIHAMLEVYGNDIERAIARLEALEDELASASEADAALA